MTTKPLFLALILTISGCSESGSLQTVINDDKVKFVAAGSDAIEISISSLGVSRDDCASDCVYWELVPDPEHLDAPEIFISGDRITYGQSLPNLVDRVAPKPLVAGRYTVSADISYRTATGQSGGGVYVDKFMLEITNGQLSLLPVEP